MKFGIIGDAHIGCADYTEKRRADYALAFKNAIETCQRADASAICLLGDVFDSAVMRRNVDAFAATLREIAPVLKRLRAEKVQLIAIAGNHEFGRGREAGELSILESLGFLRVLRAEECVVGDCGISGVPWQSEAELESLPTRTRSLARASKQRRKLLLLHNFVKGSKRIPRHLGEIDARVAEGFDRVFVGHHHDAEELGPFVMPGATEVQHVAEQASEKSVVVYDSDSNSIAFHRLPRTRLTLMLTYDASQFTDREMLLSHLDRDLVRRSTPGAFVCIRVNGVAPAGGTVTKADVHALLRSHQIHDRFVDVRTSMSTECASEVVKSASIDSLLRAAFVRETKKAQRYVDECIADNFGESIVNEILK